MRVRNMRAIVAAAMLAGVFAWGVVAHAGVIGPGDVEFPASTTVVPGGTLIATNTAPFVSTPSSVFQGTVTSQVFLNDPTNPHGGLTFTYRFTNDAGSAEDIQRMTVSPFGAFVTDVGYVPGPDVSPALFDRGSGGNTIGFSFHNPPVGTDVVGSGQSTNLLVVRTNASVLTIGTISFINGGTANTVGFVPIPEPGMLSLIAGAGLLMLRRRKA